MAKAAVAKAFNKKGVEIKEYPKLITVGEGKKERAEDAKQEAEIRKKYKLDDEETEAKKSEDKKEEKKTGWDK